MALPTRLTRICRSRVGSVWMVSGIGPAYSALSESPLASARTLISETTSASVSHGETASRSDFELAGLDFRQVQDVVDDFSRCSPLRWIVAAASMVSGSVGPLQQQIGESHDGGHGRADFVAHVGQEFALGRGGRLGRDSWPFGGLPRFVFIWMMPTSTLATALRKPFPARPTVCARRSPPPIPPCAGKPAVRARHGNRGVGPPWR